MSIRLIYGKSGSGKSNFVFNEIKETINLDRKIFVITPEQFSYISEKKLLEALNNSSSISCEILSFNRISHRVELEVGGTTNINLSESGRAMLVHSILEEHAKSLKFLGNSAENIDLIVKTITELKKHDITLGELEKSRQDVTDKYLTVKLDDICNIYKLYQNKISDKYIDEDDKLTLLSKRIYSSSMFDDAEVYIDEFVGFTAVEYEILKSIMMRAKRVNITICADNLDTDTNIETDIFFYNKQTAHKLLYYANELGIEIEKPVMLDNQYRFKNNELIHLENNINKTPYAKYGENVEKTSLFLAANPYSEIENVARKIIRIS